MSVCYVVHSLCTSNSLYVYIMYELFLCMNIHYVHYVCDYETISAY